MTEDRSTTEQTDALRLRVDLLARRLDELRLLVLRTLGFAAVGLIIAGLLVPLWTRRATFSDPAKAESLFDILLVILGVSGKDVDGEGPTFYSRNVLDVAMAVGFVGLWVVSVWLIGIMVISVVGRLGTSTRRWVSATVVWLAIVGGIVVLMFTMMAASKREYSAGWGGVLFMAGAVLSGVLLLSSRWREVWER